MAAPPSTENMNLMKGQLWVSPQRGMPVDDKGNSSSIASISGESVTLYYFHATTHALTADAGQAAGTVVVGKLAYDNIKDSLGSAEGSADNTSVALTSTCLTTLRDFSMSELEGEDANSFYKRALAVTSGFSNGQYAIDHANGVIYGVKADVTTTVTAAYKINQCITTTVSAASVDMNIAKWGNTSTSLGQKTGANSVPVVLASDTTWGTVDTELPTAAALADSTANPTTTSVGAELMAYNSFSGMWDRVRQGVGDIVTVVTGWLNVLPGLKYRSTDPTLADGQTIGARCNVSGKLITASQQVDDSAFTPATSYINVMGAEADETTPDAVDEGDAGALRMTLTRKLITASDFLEDSGHADGDYGSQVLAVRNNTLGALSGSDKDYSPLQVNASGALYTHLTTSAGVSIDTFGGADVDDAAFTVASDKGTVVMAVATSDSVDANDKGALAMTTTRHLKIEEQLAPTAEDNTSYTYYQTLRPIATAVDANSHANIMTVVNSTALEASHILKAAAGRFYYARVEIDSTATTGTYYVQLINSATVPADGSVTLLIAPIKVHHTNGTTSAVEIDRGLYGVYASSGIVVTVSTTQYTKTIITSNWMNAEGHVA